VTAQVTAAQLIPQGVTPGGNTSCLSAGFAQAEDVRIARVLCSIGGVLRTTT